jgi:tetratricopeptide (TPR) repeat protein
MASRFRNLILAVFIPGILLLSSCNGGGGKGSASRNDTTGMSIEKISEKITLNATDPKLYEERSMLYIKSGALDKALTDIKKAISLDQRNVAYYQELSDIELRMGKPQESQDALVHALTLSPNDNSTLIRLAKLNLILKDYPRTFEFIKKALETDAMNPQAYFIRGLAMLEKGDTNRAIGDLMKAVDQDQQYFDAYMTLGDLYSRRDDPMTASYYLNAVKVKPDSKEALYRLGMYYQEDGQFDKAIQTYTTLQKFHPDFRNAPYNIGYIYLVYKQEFNKATGFFNEAIRIDPQYFEAWYNLGYANELMGKYAEAEKDYHQSLKIEVNYPKAVDGLNRLDAMKIRR